MTIAREALGTTSPSAHELLARIALASEEDLPTSRAVARALAAGSISGREVDGVLDAIAARRNELRAGIADGDSVAHVLAADPPVPRQRDDEWSPSRVLNEMPAGAGSDVDARALQMPPRDRE